MTLSQINYNLTEKEVRVFVLLLLFHFHIRKWHFSTIVNKMYVIRKKEHTKKGGKHENRDNIERNKKRGTDTH